MEAVPNAKRRPPPSGVSARATMATVLIVAAIAALAITSLIHSNGGRPPNRAFAQPAPSMLTVPLSIPLDSGEVGPFAFGHVEFDCESGTECPVSVRGRPARARDKSLT